jgi:hypothetical protein
VCCPDRPTAVGGLSPTLFNNAAQCIQYLVRDPDRDVLWTPWKLVEALTGLRPCVSGGGDILDSVADHLPRGSEVLRYVVSDGTIAERPDDAQQVYDDDDDYQSSVDLLDDTRRIDVGLEGGSEN